MLDLFRCRKFLSKVKIMASEFNLARSEFFTSLRKEVPPFSKEEEVLKALGILGGSKEAISSSLETSQVALYANGDALFFPKKYATDPAFLVSMYLSCYFDTQVRVSFWYGFFRWNKFSVS